ncbi:hypothetical protein M430DRAFT_70482, partial [Amorphotheca resinae ATCC 22711]
MHHIIGVFGPPRVGKTSLILRSCGLNPFDLPYEPTIEDSHCTRIAVDGDLCTVHFVDTGGSECCNDHLRDQWTRNCRGIVFVYDISDASTFCLVREQLYAVHAFLLNLYKQFPTTPTRLIAIVGNKADKRPREVLETEGRQLADEHGAIFWETSAVDAKGFDGACINLLR